MDYEVAEIEGFGPMVVRQDGKGMSTETLDLLFELNRQNPRFYQAWLEMAESYVFLGAEVSEA